jgi:hypothetical protein
LRRDLWVVLAFVVPYALVLLLYERTYERFVIPLLPFAACAGAYAVREIARRLGAAAKPGVCVAIALTALVLPAWATWKLGTIRSAPHTTSEAAAWVREHVAPTDDVALWPQLDLPLARERAGLVSWMGPIEDAFTWVWARYQARSPDGCVPPPLYALRWWKPQLVKMAQDPEAYVREQGTYPAATRVREIVRANAELVLRISPDGRDGYSEHPLGYQDETSVAPPRFLARVLQARTTGPVIEIYRLQRH